MVVRAVQLWMVGGHADGPRERHRATRGGCSGGLGERSIQEDGREPWMLWTTRCYEAPTSGGARHEVMGNKEKDTIQDGVAEASNPMQPTEGHDQHRAVGYRPRGTESRPSPGHHARDKRATSGDAHTHTSWKVGSPEVKGRPTGPHPYSITVSYSAANPPKSPSLQAFRPLGQPRRTSIRGGLWPLRRTPPRIPVSPVLKPNTWWLTVRFAAVYNPFAAD